MFFNRTHPSIGFYSSLSNPSPSFNKNKIQNITKTFLLKKTKYYLNFFQSLIN